MNRILVGLAALACAGGCKRDTGSWSRSREELCTKVDELHRDARAHLDGVVAALAGIPPDQRTRERCAELTSDLPRLQGELSGFHQAAGAVDLGRPESAQPISTMLPTELPLIGLCTEDPGKALDMIRTSERKVEDKFEGAISECTKTGWKSVLDPVPPLPADK
jgi:hypothetical protein